MAKAVPYAVIPAQAGIQPIPVKTNVAHGVAVQNLESWIPACAGMTNTAACAGITDSEF